MADTTQTYQRSLPRPAGVRLERYLGVIAVAAGIIGVIAMFGSTETAWDYAQHVLGALYLLAQVVVG